MALEGEDKDGVIERFPSLLKKFKNEIVYSEVVQVVFSANQHLRQFSKHDGTVDDEEV